MQDDQMPKKRRFKLFDSQREGRGVTREEANLPPKLKKFFILYRRDFSRLLTINIFMVLGNFPILFLILGLSGMFSADFTRPVVEGYAVFDGLFTHVGNSGPMLALNGILGVHTMGSTLNTWGYILIGLGLLTFFTFGCVNVGTAYILRNMVKGDPVFVWSDFWYAVKRNFKQAFPFGILDLLLCILPPINIFMISSMMDGSFLYGMMFWANLIIGILYFVMRFYIYIQMVTFDLSIRKILKNSLIFSLLGAKRNILAILGMAILVILTLALAYSGILLTLAVMIPLLLLFSNCSYMATYAAYFKIEEVMITPGDAAEMKAEAEIVSE
jgi:uncharacterized membrane protein YesL